MKYCKIYKWHDETFLNEPIKRKTLWGKISKNLNKAYRLESTTYDFYYERLDEEELKILLKKIKKENDYYIIIQN